MALGTANPEDAVNILVVDDQTAGLTAAKALLQAPGRRVVTANSGREALRLLLHEDYAVILLDVQMPGLDGYETAEMIRSRDRSRDTPIIFLTAAAQADTEVFRGYSVGAVDYVFKPIAPEILKSKVAAFVELYCSKQVIRRQAERLRQSEALYRTLVEQGPAVMFVRRSEAPFATSFVSENVEAQLGFAPRRFTDDAAFWMNGIHGDDTPRVLDGLSQLLETGRVAHEYRFRHKDGSWRWMYEALMLLRDDADKAADAVGFWTDITERKDAEIAIHRLTAELEHKNRELEAFSYSVTHDLRAPLRAIDGFTRMFLEQYEECIDEHGRRYLTNVQTGAARMGELIDDLLKLSLVSRGALNRARVDLSALARAVVDDLHKAEPERRVPCEIEDGLMVEADGQLLRVVLDNLLRNAWKFTSKTPEPRIAVGAEVQSGGAAYFVRDNGAGFDMRHAEKLFQPFQRLHDDSQFQGTGIGLATVYRVVDRHGGRVWAEGAVGRGATFFFTLPNATAQTTR